MTQSNIDLSTITAAIASFKALPVYALLANFPAVLIDSQFIVSKENSNPLKGSHELFLSTDFVASFDLPDLIAKPIKPVKPAPDDYKGSAKSNYLVALDSWSDSLESFDVEFGATNTAISTLAKAIDRDDILRKYTNLQRCINFLKSTLAINPSAFEVDDLLELNELPQPIKTKILSVYQAAFRANPVLLTMGSTVDLIAADPRCNLDSAEGIDAIVKIQDSHKGAKYGFVSKGLMIAVVKQVKSSLNAPTLVKLFDSLVSNGATSKNASTILSNLKKLF